MNNELIKIPRKVRCYQSFDNNKFYGTIVFKDAVSEFLSKQHRYLIKGMPVNSSIPDEGSISIAKDDIIGEVISVTDEYIIIKPRTNARANIKGLLELAKQGELEVKTRLLINDYNIVTNEITDMTILCFEVTVKMKK